MKKKSNKKRKKKFNINYKIIVSLILFIFVVVGFYYIITPKVKLVGSDVVTIGYKDEYKDKGVIAKNIFGKDISKNVTVKGKIKHKVGTYKITYVVDNYLSVREVTRTVKLIDNIDPNIELSGSDTTYVILNNEYNEPGYSANDEVSGDLTDQVNVSGDVNTNEVGEYTLTYTVKDKNGNESKIERKVKVVEYVDPDGGNLVVGGIYLTFDDGPQEGTTNVILDILKEEGVKATFFVTSKGPDELIKREYDEGHVVALHTSSHDYASVYASDEAFFADLGTVHDRVQRITGVDSRIIRFPGGSSNTISRRYSPGIMSRITTEVINRGYRYYDWNISSGDAGETTSPDGVYSNVVNNLSHDKANMVLMHDIKWYTRDALRNIIRYGKDNGYTFEVITMDTKMIRQRVNN